MPRALEEKLADAQTSQSRKRKKILGYGALGLVAVLVVALLAYLTVQLDRARTQLQETVEAIPVPQSQDSDDGTTSPETTHSQTAATATATEEAQPAEDDATDADVDENTLRGQFAQALAKYEDEVEPELAAILLGDWDAETNVELADLKVIAIEQFSQGEYAPAHASLQRANALAAEAMAEYARRLAALKRAANEAFANGRASQAQDAIQQALRLNPADAQMLALQKRAAVLPQVLDLLRQAQAAKNENRPEKEAAALQKILAIDPARTALEPRLKTLQAQLTQQRFSGAIKAAQSALAAGDLSVAEKQIALAKSIFPANEALAPLQKQLREALIEREFNKQISLGEQAAQRDDWQAATTRFARAQQLKPNDQTAVVNHNRAQQVVATTQKISDMLAREHRLGDDNVIASAAEYLRETETLAATSPRLQTIHDELANKVELYATEVEVVVVSDNATHIIVRGEGQVGKTARRSIRLRPGKRVFEGSRAGYKSKLVTLNIAPGTTSVEVTVICDEKI